MDIRQLRCFDAVLTTGTMTKAASLLGLSQPTVSITIAQLEKEIGFKLFNRSKGWIQPTAEAFELHRSAINAVEGVNRVDQVAKEIKRQNKGEISILCYPGIAWQLLPALIQNFRSNRQGVRIRLISRSSTALRQLTQAQNFDVAILEAPVTLPEENVELINFECMCALPNDHQLLARDHITPKDIDSIPFAMLFADHATHHQIKKAFFESNAALNIVLECDYFLSACSFVGNSGGVSIIDPITASQITTSLLDVRPFSPTIDYQIAIVRPANRASSKISDEFYQLVKQELTKISTMFQSPRC